MSDFSCLRSWVDPRHLEEESLKTYREAAMSHPARLVCLKSFLRDDIAEKVSRFLVDEADFQTVRQLRGIPGYVSEEEWSKAEDSERFFRFGTLVGARPEFQLSVNVLTFLKLRSTFSDSGFKVFFEKMVELPLGTTTPPHAYAFKNGDFLRLHNDNEDNRHLAVILYLSPDWDASYGGALHFTGKNMDPIKIEVEYNQLIAFDVTADAQHYVEIVSSDAENRSRVTIGWWFYKQNLEAVENKACHL